MNVFETQRYRYRSSQAIKENSFLKIKRLFPQSLIVEPGNEFFKIFLKISQTTLRPEITFIFEHENY